MLESDFIKAIQLLFPKGNPLRDVTDYVSKVDSIDKLTSLLLVKDRLESEYKLVAFVQLYSPNNNCAHYLDEIKQELDKKISSPKIIRKSLRAIKSLGGIITEKAVEFGIDHVIASLPV